MSCGIFVLLNSAMCDNCFNREVKPFPDKASWEKFDIELTTKISEGKLKEVAFNMDLWKHMDDGYYQYQCQSCGQHWMLKDPDLPWDPAGFHGSLLKTSGIKKMQAPRMGVVSAILLFLLGLIILRVLYYLSFE